MVVFKIFSKVSGQYYVGSCRSDIDERWELYLRAAEAGLEFPLYKEIREHGEGQFTIDELDFADDIAELKEMELLHTIELSARSLRSYKFGLTDAVVKRIRQVEHERAWMKDLPEEPVRTKVTPPLVVKRGAKNAVAQSVAPAVTDVVKSSAHKIVQDRSKKDQPVAVPSKPKSLAAKFLAPSVTVAERSSDRIEKQASASRAVPGVPGQIKTKPTETAPADASAELDKAMFAEGIGLLVRAVASVEQFSRYQQQAKDEALSQARALAESERALQQLQLLQDEAAIKAQSALEAVAAVQAASSALINAQRQTRERSAATLAAIEKRGEMPEQAAQLQQEFSRLLMRIKMGASSRPVSASTSNPTANPVASAAVSAHPALEAKRQGLAAVAEQPQEVSHVGSVKSLAFTAVPVEPKQAPTLTPVVLENALGEEQKHRVKAQEAGMVNQLKQLGNMLVKDQLASADSAALLAEADDQGAQVSPLNIKSPARAWIATSADDVESALVLVNKSKPTTVVHRRPKASKAVPSGASAAIGRKTLSIKSR